MKKDYNQNTMTDMPLDASFPAPINTIPSKKTTTKPKINAIGKKATAQTKRKISSKVKTEPIKAEPKTKTATRTKITKDNKKLDDLEKLNEESLKTYRANSKRDRVVIVLLSVSLVIAIVAISIYLILSKMETNCNMYVHGATASYIIDGEELDKFRTPQNLQGNRVLKIDIKIKIEESGKFNIKFSPECFQKGVLLENTLIYEPNFDLFYEGADGFYYSKNHIEGNQTIQLCGGIILDYYYENTLNVENFRLDFHTYFEKV